MIDRVKPLRVAVVGACSSGKSTLVQALLNSGFEARHVAQEHSYVVSMWQKICDPDVLIYLDVDLENIKARWPHGQFGERDLLEQNRRLAHARANCDLYLNTSHLDPDEVAEKALAYLEKAG